MSDVMTIGIAGGTGSGKTTLTKRIAREFGGDISIVYHDNYYKAHNDLPLEERAKLNYDHPDAFDMPLFIKHIKMLREGKQVESPVYDYSIHNRSNKTVVINPTKVIVAEGILLFHDPELCKLLDIKIFVDTDADERILRRILRDVNQRNRTLDSVIEQYRKTVKPMHEQFVEPSKRNADIIVLDGGYNLVALDMIMQRIRLHVDKSDLSNELLEDDKRVLKDSYLLG